MIHEAPLPEDALADILAPLHAMRSTGPFDGDSIISALLARASPGYWNLDIPSCAAVSTAQALDALSRIDLGHNLARETFENGLTWLLAHGNEPQFRQDYWDDAEVARVLLRIQRNATTLRIGPALLTDLDERLALYVPLLKQAAERRDWREGEAIPLWYGPAFMVNTALVLELSGESTLAHHLITEVQRSASTDGKAHGAPPGTFWIEDQSRDPDIIIWNQAQALIGLARISNGADREGAGPTKLEKHEVASVTNWLADSIHLTSSRNDGEHLGFWGSERTVDHIPNVRPVCTAASALALYKWRTGKPQQVLAARWFEMQSSFSDSSLQTTTVCAAASLLLCMQEATDIVVSLDQISAFELLLKRSIQQVRDLRADNAHLLTQLSAAQKDVSATRADVQNHSEQVLDLERKVRDLKRELREHHADEVGRQGLRLAKISLFIGILFGITGILIGMLVS